MAGYHRNSRRGSYGALRQVQIPHRSDGTSILSRLGKRRLAFPINKRNEGVYTLINFTSEATSPPSSTVSYKSPTAGCVHIVAKKKPFPRK
jgi:hypothetical protein